jgi:hypothetical protein
MEPAEEETEVAQLWSTRVQERRVMGGGMNCEVIYGEEVICSSWRERAGTSERYKVFASGMVVVLEYCWSNARGVYRRELVFGRVLGEPLGLLPCVHPGLEVLLCARGKRSVERAQRYLELCTQANLMDRVELHQRAHQWLLAQRELGLLVGRHLDSFGLPKRRTP